MWLIFCRNEFLLQTEIGSRPVYGANCVLAIGNWSNPQGSTCRGPSTMCVGLRRKLARRFDCIDIDEYKTSKVCSRYHGILERTQRHHLLKCQCTIDCQNDIRSMGSGIINRDVNASRNILLLAECLINGHPRPAAFNSLVHTCKFNFFK